MLSSGRILAPGKERVRQICMRINTRMVDRDNIPEVCEGARTPAGPEKEETGLCHACKKRACEFAKHRWFPVAKRSDIGMNYFLRYIVREMKTCMSMLRNF